MRPPLTLALTLAVALRLGVALAQAETHVDIQIRADNTCLVDEQRVPCGEVGAKLHELGTPSKATIHVHADKDAKYEVVASALDSLLRAGFPRKLGYINVGPE